MKPLPLRHLVPASLLVAALLVVLSGRGPATAQPQAPQTIQQWEYKVISGNSPAAPDFNELGAQGWELCGVTAGGFNQGGYQPYYSVFKRPKR
jgi:hypothetical protein